MGNVEVESQSPNPSIKESFLSKYKLLLGLMGVVFATFLGFGGAWLAGAFEEEEVEMNSIKSKLATYNADADPVTMNKDECNSMLKDLEGRKKVGNYRGLLRRLRNQKLIWDLNDSSVLNKEQCLQLEEVKNNQNRYQLDKTIMEKFYEQCLQNKHLTKVAENSVPTPQEHEALKTFLSDPANTLKLLIERNDAVAIASFKALNNMSYEDRKTALGQSETLMKAFDNLLQTIIANSDRSDSDMEILSLAVSKSEELGIKPDQLELMNKILESNEDEKPEDEKPEDEKPKDEDPKKEKTAQQEIDHATAEKPIVREKLTAEKLKEVLALLKNAIKTEAQKISDTEKKVNENALLMILNTQAKFGYDNDLKFEISDVKEFEDQCQLKLDNCDPELKKAIESVGENGENYRQIYNVYAKNDAIKEASGANAVDYVCSKAIIAQVTNPSGTFGRNSYQVLCLALSAHNLLRGNFKTVSAKAVPAAKNIEDAARYLIGFNLTFDFFKNWAKRDIQKFMNAIIVTRNEYYTEMRNQKLDTLISWIEIQQIFVAELVHLLQILERAFTCSEDSRKDLVAKAFTYARNWSDDIAAEKAFVEEALKLNLSANLNPLILSVLRQRVDPLVEEINKMNVSELECYKKFLKLCLDSRLLDDVRDDNVKALIGYANFLTMASQLPKTVASIKMEHSDKLNYIITLGDSSISELIEEMQKNEALKNVVKAMSKPLSYLGTIALELSKAVNRCDGYNKLGITEPVFSEKFSKLKASVISDLSAAFSSNEKDQEYVVKLINSAIEIDLAALLTTDELLAKPELKKNVALFYSLTKAYNAMPAIPEGAVAEESTLDAFLSTESKNYIQDVFVHDYIEINRDKSKKLKTKSTGKFLFFGTEKISWEHSEIEFSPFKTILGPAITKMDAFAAANNVNGFIKEDVEGCPAKQYKVNVDKGKSEFEKASDALVFWALKTVFHNSS